MRKRPFCPPPQPDLRKRKRSRTRNGPTPPMTLEEAMAEARRCLWLNDCEGCEVCVLMCPDQAITKDPGTRRAVIDLRFCKGCGLCAHVCPKGAIKMVPDS